MVSAVAAALHRQGLKVGVVKPVETGCDVGSDGRRWPQDAAQLQYFAQCQLDLQTICPYALTEPLAPLVAAQREQVVIDVEHLVRALKTVAATHDVTLVEGAGGLLVPIALGVTFADLAARLGAPVVVVVGSKLGAINHALLTIRYAQSVGLCVLGYVINFLTAEPDLAARTNVDVLTEWCGPPLGVLPYLGTVTLTDACRRRLADVCTERLRLSELVLPC